MKYTHDLTKTQYAIIKEMLRGNKLRRSKAARTRFIVGDLKIPDAEVFPLWSKGAIKTDYDNDVVSVTDYGRELVAKYEQDNGIKNGQED